MDGLGNAALELTPFAGRDLFPAARSDHRKPELAVAVCPLAGACKIICRFYGHCARAMSKLIVSWWCTGIGRWPPPDPLDAHPKSGTGARDAGFGGVIWVE